MKEESHSSCVLKPDNTSHKAVDQSESDLLIGIPLESLNVLKM